MWGFKSGEDIYYCVTVIINFQVQDEALCFSGTVALSHQTAGVKTMMIVIVKLSYTL